MKSARFELFYSPLCHTCSAAKEVVRRVAEEEGIRLEEINVLSLAGEKRVREYKIQGVPNIWYW